MRILKQIDNSDFPFDWVNLDYYPDSDAQRKEIYLIKNYDKVEELIILFYYLFGESKEDIYIYYKSWWDFCLDTWDPKNDEYHYDLYGKSKETIDYLCMLKDSDVKLGYSGSCGCLDWDLYLKIILECIIKHIAPFSPIFHNKKHNFFFYFHHTGSIGFYYHEENSAIDRILEKAYSEDGLNIR